MLNFQCNEKFRIGMEILKITKLQASKRQLETAIQLYFKHIDPISIHTLACAAYEILSDVNKARNGSPMLMDGCLIKDEYKKKYRKMIREPQNFLKHADKDPDRTLDFNPDVSTFFIYEGISKYQEITGEVSSLFRIFRGWYCAQNVEQFYFPENQKKIIQNMRDKYGNDRSLYFIDMLEVSHELY